MWSRCSAAAPTPATRSLAPRMVDPDLCSFAPILRSIPAITLARASSNHAIYDASLTSRAPLPSRDPSLQAHPRCRARTRELTHAALPPPLPPYRTSATLGHATAPARSRAPPPPRVMAKTGARRATPIARVDATAGPTNGYACGYRTDQRRLRLERWQARGRSARLWAPLSSSSSPSVGLPQVYLAAVLEYLVAVVAFVTQKFVSSPSRSPSSFLSVYLLLNLDPMSNVDLVVVLFSIWLDNNSVCLCLG
jgi:hypothetical protein